MSRPVLEGFVAAQTNVTRGLERAGMGQGDKLAGEGFALVHGFLGNFGEWTANPLLLSHGLGMWALSGLIVSRFNFAQHVTIACLALFTISGLGVVAEWSEFFLPRIPMLWIAGLFGYGLVLAGVVYSHLGAASALWRRSRLWAAAAVSLVVVGTSAVSDFPARSKFSTIMEYSGVVKPIDAAWVPAPSVDEFFASSEKLKGELDKLTKKAKALHCIKDLEDRYRARG